MCRNLAKRSKCKLDTVNKAYCWETRNDLVVELVLLVVLVTVHESFMDITQEQICASSQHLTIYWQRGGYLQKIEDEWCHWCGWLWCCSTPGSGYLCSNECPHSVSGTDCTISPKQWQLLHWCQDIWWVSWRAWCRLLRHRNWCVSFQTYCWDLHSERPDKAWSLM